MLDDTTYRTFGRARGHVPGGEKITEPRGQLPSRSRGGLPENR